MLSAGFVDASGLRLFSARNHCPSQERATGRFVGCSPAKEIAQEQGLAAPALLLAVCGARPVLAPFRSAQPAPHRCQFGERTWQNRQSMANSLQPALAVLGMRLFQTRSGRG